MPSASPCFTLSPTFLTSLSARWLNAPATCTLAPEGLDGVTLRSHGRLRRSSRKSMAPATRPEG